MTRLLCILATLSVCFGAASCGQRGPVILDEIGKTTAALTIGSCNGTTPQRAVSVHYSNGTCDRYFLGAAGWQDRYLIQPAGKTITSVDTGLESAAWVCDTSQPRGWTESPYAPCWSGGINNGFRRIRGSWVDAPTYAYAAASANVTNIVGRSVVLSTGRLGVGIPTCPQTSATCWHGLVEPWYSDYGFDAFTGSTDPACGPGSQISGRWPATNGVPGPFGAPCLVNFSPSGYGEIYYAPF